MDQSSTTLLKNLRNTGFMKKGIPKGCRVGVASKKLDSIVSFVNVKSFGRKVLEIGNKKGFRGIP
jgi:hypothetical protein